MNFKKTEEMKQRVLSIIALFSMLAASFMSCTNNDNDGPETETGSVKVNFSFEKNNLKATQSTAKPTTDWTDVNQLMVLFVDQSTNEVKAARVLTPPTTAITTTHNEVLSNVPAGTFDAYLVANYNEANITRTNGGGVNWNEGNVVGQDITTLTLKMTTHSGFTATSTETGVTAYQSPAEVFMDKQAVTIVADSDASATFALTRIVSLFRVRIDQSQNGNDVVDFTHVNADFRIRKVATTYNPQSGVATAVAATDLVYHKGAYNNAEPTSGYSTGTILDASNNLKIWADHVIFPGGSSTSGANKFDIVLSGMAPVGYLPYGSTNTLTAATKVYWSGQVQQAVLSNNILEVNCVLKQAGSTDVPEVGTYGNLEVDVDIIGWGNISSTDLEI